MVIIVVISGVLVPSFAGVYGASRLRAATRSVFAQCRYARDLAIRRQTYARMVFDSVEGTHHVVVLEPAEESAPDQTEVEREWQATGSTLGAEHRLPDGIVFDRMISGDEAAGEEITFQPDGRADDWWLSLRDQHERRLAVHVTGTTGIVEVVGPENEEAFAALDAQGEP